jgi:hypothetical protein
MAIINAISNVPRTMFLGDSNIVSGWCCILGCGPRACPGETSPRLLTCIEACRYGRPSERALKANFVLGAILLYEIEALGIRLTKLDMQMMMPASR